MPRSAALPLIALSRAAAVGEAPRLCGGGGHHRLAAPTLGPVIGGWITDAQASTMAYADAFLAVMAAFALATPLVLLMRRTAPPAKPVADAH